MLIVHFNYFFFFFNDTATTEIYTLSLHDALPIWVHHASVRIARKTQSVLNLQVTTRIAGRDDIGAGRDRKSTRLNSSHLVISYAVFCLKKKKTHARTSRMLTTQSVDPRVTLLR